MTSNKALDRIVQENSSVLRAGVLLDQRSKRDGRTARTSACRVAGHADAQVTYRKRYAAPRGRAPSNTAAGKPLDPSSGRDGRAHAVAGHAAAAGPACSWRLTAIAQKGAGKNADARGCWSKPLGRI